MSNIKEDLERRVQLKWEDTFIYAVHALHKNAVVTNEAQILALIVKPNGEYSYSCMSTDANDEASIRQVGGELAMHLFDKKWRG